MSNWFAQPPTQSTTSAPSLFGQPQQQQQQPSLFGQPQQSTTPSLFGQSQQQPATGLFGQPQQQQQSSSGSSLFGQPQQQQQASTGLFGQQQPSQPTTGLFGQQQQQQQPTTGLFGQQQQQPTTGLFGQQQQQPTTGLFGQQQQQPTTGLFGQSQQQQPQQQTTGTTGTFGSWGQPSQSAATTGFGGLGQQNQPQQTTQGWGSLGQSTAAQTSLFGQPTSGQATQQQQQQQNFLLGRQTKFNDLPDNFKSAFETIESQIQGRINISNDLAQRSQKQRGTDTLQPIRAVNREAVATASVLESDMMFATHLKARVDQANQDLVLATRILDGYKNHVQHGAHLKNYASFPLEFFQHEAQDLRERLQWCKSAMEQIERKLASSSKPVMQQAAISHAMQAQHSTFMALAGATAQVHAEVERLKVAYTSLYRSKVGGAHDPFQDTR